MRNSPKAKENLGGEEKAHMKILFVCDLFPPFVKGGGEISVYWQARELVKKGIKVIVLAPKYKKKFIKFKSLSSLKVRWFYLPFRVNSMSPIIFLNPLYVFYQLIQLIKVAKKEKIDLIHCQGKYSMPAAVLTKYLLKIPLILTLRDYKGICNHGFCLYKKKKGCSLFSFFKEDFLFYFKNYVKKKNCFSFLFQFIVSYIGRINTIFLSLFMRKADKFVCVSNYVAGVYAKNGYDRKKMITIYNLAPKMRLKEVKMPKMLRQKIKKFKHSILYAGKLSLGKGADLLIDAAQEVIKKRNDILFIFCGKIHYPIRKIQSEQLLFLNKVEYFLLLKIMSLIDIVCVPSIWPEPLSRVAIEAFSLEKPVLSSSVGGPKELVSSKNGWLFEPTKEGLKRGIKNALKDEKNWMSLGERGRQTLLNLEKEQIDKLISLYKKITPEVCRRRNTTSGVGGAEE